VAKLIKSTQPYQAALIGVVSDASSDFNLIGHNIKPEDNPKPIALNGRIPVKISLENGPIAVGDPITSSSESGKAMKAVKSGRIIGYALEDYNGPDETNGGKVMIFVNNGFLVAGDLQPEEEEEAISWVEKIWDALVAKLTDWLKTAVLAIKELFTEKVVTQELCVGSTCITESQLQALLNGQAGPIGPISPISPISPIGQEESADTEPPVITLIGDAVIEIEINTNWSDPGATVSDPAWGEQPQNDNLGYKVSLNDGPEIYPNELTLDTSVAGTSTITYIAVDQAGNKGTATRTVVVIGPISPIEPTEPAPSEPSPTSDTSSETSSTSTPPEPAATTIQ
jgi:hypothetical protein